MTASRTLTAAIIVLGSIVGEAQDAITDPNVIRAGGIEFSFASVEEGRRLLSTRDRFADAMSPFDRQVRMQTERDEGVDAFLNFAAGEVIEWNDAQREKAREALESINEPLSKLRLPKIERIALVYTTGREEAGTAYTRGSTIVFQRGNSGRDVKTRVMAHELFHVLTRHDRKLRDQLYSTIGFTPGGKVALPNDLALRQITNPDAPAIEHVMRVKISEDRTAWVAPVLYSELEYDADKKGSLFSYLKFQLMEVMQIVGKKWVPKLIDGKPVFHEPALPDFHRQIGSNTRYIIHPEEILADNFAMMVMSAPCKDQWLIDAIREKFGKEGESSD